MGRKIRKVLGRMPAAQLLSALGTLEAEVSAVAGDFLREEASLRARMGAANRTLADGQHGQVCRRRCPAARRGKQGSVPREPLCMRKEPARLQAWVQSVVAIAAGPAGQPAEAPRAGSMLRAAVVLRTDAPRLLEWPDPRPLPQCAGGRPVGLLCEAFVPTHFDRASVHSGAGVKRRSCSTKCKFPGATPRLPAGLQTSSHCVPAVRRGRVRLLDRSAAPVAYCGALACRWLRRWAWAGCCCGQPGCPIGCWRTTTAGPRPPREAKAVAGCWRYISTSGWTGISRHRGPAALLARRRVERAWWRSGSDSRASARHRR